MTRPEARRDWLGTWCARQLERGGIFAFARNLLARWVRLYQGTDWEDIYWGSHGCHRKPGHRGWHMCECGGLPYHGRATYFYGDDTERPIGEGDQ